jgi:hypothetical protein
MPREGESEMVYDGPNPDMDWYLRLSSARHVTPRCPFASVKRCPRYYQSLSLLGEAGNTKIPAEEDDLLKALWERERPQYLVAIIA